MSGRSERCFLDTNIIVYAWSDGSSEKGELARALISQNTKQNLAAISTQVLQEFYSVVTSKMGCDKLIAKEAMLYYARLPIVQVDLASIQQAIDISILSQLSFWDALVIASAEKANCKTLYSEDLNDGQMIRGITVVNPFLTNDV